jgi:para-aminobenzoate synthetase/4-amino-4-deoxychorismate lyase
MNGVRQPRTLGDGHHRAGWSEDLSDDEFDQAGSARFDDAIADSAIAFRRWERMLVATVPDEVPSVIEAVDHAARHGWWAYGYAAYEAAAGLNDRHAVNRDTATPSGVVTAPLVWFGLARHPLRTPVVSPPTTGGIPCQPEPTIAWSFAEYRRAFGRVKEAIAAGDTYQCNLTTTMSGRLACDPYRFYANLVHAQRCRYGAYLNCGDFRILSASPELFFDWTGDRILTKPMKGTAKRGSTLAEDRAAIERLRTEPKERAENVIVVDLLRNDLGMIAVTGTVSVPHLLSAERYETVWQLTSEVAATVRPSTTLVDVFRALFPCGSVTGAPKVSTMALIDEAEQGPRGVYCGAIGIVAPPGAPFRARFPPAIRTAVVQRSGQYSYGIGSGITWGSHADAENAELLSKTAILTHSAEPFELIETMRYVAGDGVWYLQAHVARLLSSARYFGFRFDARAFCASVHAAVDGAPTAVVHVAVSRAGVVRLDVRPTTFGGAPLTVAIDEQPLDASGPWFRHKTTRRDAFAKRKSRHADVDEVIVVNDRGHVTGATSANIAIREGNRWLTPPRTDGCLPGILRSELVAKRVLHERTLRPEDVARSPAVLLISTARGCRRARLA